MHGDVQMSLRQYLIVLILLWQGLQGNALSVTYTRPDDLVKFGSESLGWMNAIVRELNTDCTMDEGVESSCSLKPVAHSDFRIQRNEYYCAGIQIETSGADTIGGICFDFDMAMWYGGSELQYQRWPIQRNISLPFQPFTTNDIVTSNHSFGNVIERYWLNSKGLGIYVDEVVPLSATIFDKSEGNNEPRLCLFARKHPRIKTSTHKNSIMQLHLCVTENIFKTHQVMSNTFFEPPNGHPDERMFMSPIWSTRAKYKTDIDEAKVLEYADEIVKHGFSNSQLEIDDMFSSHYGDFDFNSEKFSKPKNMIMKLKQLGFRVTVCITPFANLDSVSFNEGIRKGFWLKNIDSDEAALVKWWHGIGAILDVDNKEAVDWFLRRLADMKSDFGVDSFKFDAGELTYVPELHEHLTKWDDPTTYTSKYVAAVSKMGPMIQVRCGYRTQSYPVFVRMGDKESRWGYDNGLKSLIPTILTLGILGYPYLMPDMIGGNGYVYTEDNSFTAKELPSRELYIRWLQVSAYMPAMKFSFVPWQYDDEVVSIAKTYVNIHEKIVTPMILDVMNEVQIKGYPLIRPLWWIAPTDLYALECETEFLIGNNFLVAPVLDEGATDRDIYLPEGMWEDKLRANTVKGGTWLRKYPVELHEVPTFKRLLK